MTDELITSLHTHFDADERDAQQLDHMPACGFSGECDCLLAERRRRALAEVEAKRRILNEHTPEKAGTRTVCAVCAEGPYYDATWHDWPCDTVKLLALPFEGWPGYPAGWRS